MTPAAARTTRRARNWLIPVAGAGVVAACVWCVPEPVPSDPPRATVSLTETKGGPPREAIATVKLDPRTAADGARWLNVTAWQGGAKVVNQLEPVGPGTYRSTQALPLHGNWKSTLRLQTGRSVLGLPIYMPADEAIPVAGVPAPARFTREFQDDKQLLQREQKKGVSPVLKTVAYLAVLAIALVVAALLVIGLRRIRDDVGGDGPPDTAPPRQSERPRPPSRVPALR